MQSQTRVAESVAWFPFDESARDCPAILAPGRPELTYSELERHVSALAGSLATAGLKRTARVATMPAGAESAAAFLGVAAAAVCAPLTPPSAGPISLRSDDFSRLEAVFPHLEQRWDAHRGAADLALRLREHGLTNADRPRFTRLHRLSELREGGALSPSLRWAPGQPLATASPT